MTDSNSSSSSESSQLDQEAKWKNKISAAYEADVYGKCFLILHDTNWNSRIRFCEFPTDEFKADNCFGDDDADLYKNQYNESYDQWADRIFQEYSKRNKRRQDSIITQQRGFQSDKNPSSSSFSSRPKIDAPKAEHINPSLATFASTSSASISKNASYAKLVKLLSKDCTDTISSKKLLPFHKKSSSDAIIEAILCGNGNDEKPDQRKAIRDAIRLWHPDKFAQMFSQRIPSNESDRVMEIVHVVTQALLNYGKWLWI